MSLLSKPTLADKLVERGLLNRQQLDRAYRRQHHALQFEQRKLSLEDVLRETRAVDLVALDQLMAEESGNEKFIPVDIPIRVRKKMLIKVDGGVRGDVLHVRSIKALSEAQRKELMDIVTSRRIKCIGVTETAGDSNEILSSIHGEAIDASRLGQAIGELNAAGEAGASNLRQTLEMVVHDAVEAGASDIHIQYTDSALGCEIRYRIGSRCVSKYDLTPASGRLLFSQLKTAAGMDAAMHYREQDGRISVMYQDRRIDLRVNTMPQAGGEVTAMRLFDPRNLKPLPLLFQEHPVVLARLRTVARLERKEPGLVLVSGATGSGKSTSLYSVVSSLDRDGLKVMSIEDPVEQMVFGVNQTAVNLGAGLDFKNGLRAFMRQDPDVLLVGETRDEETLSLLVKAAETGHFCFSTVHAGDVLTSFSRLQSLVDGPSASATLFSLSQTLRIVMNQSLEQRLCPHCATRVAGKDHPVDYLREFAIERGWGDRAVPMRVGCERCNDTGLSTERVQVPELLALPQSPEVRQELFELWSKQNRVGEILKHPSVFYYSKADAVETLLAGQHIDLTAALRILGRLKA